MSKFNKLKWVWQKAKHGWVDLAWEPKLIKSEMNWVAAYRVATYVDIEDMDRDAVIEGGSIEFEPDAYWHVVYNPYGEPDEFLLRTSYTEQELQKHIKLKCKLLNVEARAIARLNTEYHADINVEELNND